MTIQFLFFGFLSMSLIMGVTACFSDVRASGIGRVMIAPIVLVYLSMTVSRTIFSDSIFYQDTFNSSEFLISRSLEPGFELYTLAFASLGSWPIYLISFPILLLAGGITLYKALQVQIRYRTIIFLTLVWPFFWAYSMTGFRQSLAITMGLFALTALIRERFVFAIVLFVVAIQFHASAVLLLITIIAYRFRKSSGFFVSIWVGSLIAAAAFPLENVLSFIFSQGVLNADFGHYFDGNFGQAYTRGLRPNFIFMSMLPILAFWVKRPTEFADETALRTAFHAYLLLNAVGNVASSIPYSDRVYAYSWIIVPTLLAAVWGDIPQWARACVVAILLYLTARYSVYWLGL
jgi:hypothetical protein